jgi:hypothetical protein
VADSVADVTKHVGEVSGHSEDWAGKGADWAARDGLGAVEKIVAAFEQLLGTVEAAVDELLQRGMEDRDRLQQERDRLQEAAQELLTQLKLEGDRTEVQMIKRRLLEQLSQTVSAFLNAAVGDYGFLASTVRSSGEALVRGLEAAGQKPLSGRLAATFSISGVWLESLESQLRSWEEKLSTGGISPILRDAHRFRVATSFLESASSGACSASEAISKFADIFQRGFRDANDHLTDAVVSQLPADMTAKIYMVTSAVHHLAGNIAWKLDNAKRELILGVDQGLADIANAMKIRPSPVVDCRPTRGST